MTNQPPMGQPPMGQPPMGQPPMGQPTLGQPAGLPWGGVPPPPASERFRLAWQRRAETDYIFDYWTALGWTVLSCGLFGLYVIYQLVRRARDHNIRRLELLDAAITVGWDEAARRGLQDELTPSFQRAAAHLAVLRHMTTEFRDPIVWVVLCLVARGIVELVAFILLDQDLVKHDKAEVGIEYELAHIYGRFGLELAMPDQSRVKGEHAYAERVIAAVFSLGIYLLWWYYDVMAEGNRHFHANWRQEDALAGAVQAVVNTSPAS